MPSPIEAPRRHTPTWALTAAIAAVASVLTVVVLLPAPWNFAAAAIILGALGCVFAPLGVLIFVWGALLPIWTVASVDPLVFDALRFGLAGVIFIKGIRQPRAVWSGSARRIAVILAAVGALVGAIGLLRPEAQAATTGLTMVLGSVISWIVLTRITQPWALLNGYLAGTALSAIVLVLAGFGYPTVTPLDFAGYARLSGLSPSATLVTYQMALGVVVAMAAVGRKSARPAYVLLGLLSLFALLLSGGRGGIVALALVALVAVRWRWIRPVPAILGAAAVAGLVAWAVNEGVALNTLDRLTEETAGSDARTGLFAGAMQTIVENPIVGTGFAAFEASYGALPHIALQTFFILGGIACGIPILWVFFLLVRRLAVVNPRPFGHDGFAGHMILAVFMATVFLEPTGPFVGAAFVTLLLLGVSLTEKRPPEDDTEAEIEREGLALSR